MKIIIPGIPVPQGRMRSRVLKGFVITYDPNAKEKESIRDYLKQYQNDLLDNGLSSLCDGRRFKYPRISFFFNMPVPKSIRKKDAELYNSGFLKHDKKPDIDNLVKLYLDCLDGIVIDGDQRVSLGPCIKIYDKEPRTEIWINETKPTIDAGDIYHASYLEPTPDELSFSEKVGHSD